MSLSSYISSIPVIVSMFRQLIGQAWEEAGIDRACHYQVVIKASSTESGKAFVEPSHCTQTCSLFVTRFAFPQTALSQVFPLLIKCLHYPGNPIPTPHDSVQQSLTTEWAVSDGLNGNEIGINIPFFQGFDGCWSKRGSSEPLGSRAWATVPILTRVPQSLAFTNFY